MKRRITQLVALLMVVCCNLTLTNPSFAFTGNLNASPTGITINVSTLAPTCYGGSNGSVDITVNGGTAPYSYLWSTGATTEDISGLVSGGYSVTVTDIQGVVKTKSVNVASAINIQGYISCNKVCYGSCTGSADLTIMTGTAPFTFHWSNGASTEDVTNLCAGVYTVTVKDANGCSKLMSTQIQSYTQIVLNTTKTDLNCSGVCIGAIDLSVSGGTAPYAYAWSNGATTEDLIGLCAGPYSVTVTDFNGCQKVKSLSILQPVALNLSLVPNSIPCYGVCTGAVNATVTGGTAPYSFLWSNGYTNEDLYNVCTGNYSLTVTDAKGCVKISSTTISQPQSPLNISETHSDIPCNNACNGSINITVTGGTAPYSYLWNSGATTEDRSGLCQGTFCVTVTDANNCKGTKCVTINQTIPPTISLTPTHLVCNNMCTGAIDLNVISESAPFSYNWSNGATIEDISGLCAGVYCVTVTDVNGCTASDCVTITEPTPIVLTPNHTDNPCFGNCMGTVSVSADGGVAPYSYHWANGSSANGMNGLCNGEYCVTVYDSHQCSAVICIVVSSPSALDATAGKTDVSCNGVCDGTANVVANGGTTPYSYLWSNGNTNSDMNGLCAGEYCVTVYDAHQCSVVKCITVSQPDVLNATASATDLNCYNVCIGTASVSANGGTAPYSYLWSNGGTNSSISGLCAGEYCVTVVDAHNCQIVKCATVHQPSILSAEKFSTNVSCYGACDGTASVVADGGTAPYSYAWFNGGNNSSVNGLCAGEYCVTVYDAHQCAIVKCVTITQPDALDATASANNAGCYGGCNGTASVSATGGTSPYSYIWSNGNTNSNITGLCAGEYCVTVYDAHQCSIVKCVTVNQPAHLQGYITCSQILCNGNCNGTADLTVIGGTAPFTYHWSNNASTEDISGLCAGIYCVTVTDANGCTVLLCNSISEPSALTATANSTNATCYNACNGTASVSANGGTAPYTYVWSNGNTNSNISGLCAGSYSVTVYDANQCSVVKNVSVTEPTVLNATASATPVNCYNVCNGTASVSANGGTAPYSYLWSNGNTNSNIIGLCAGSYSVTVYDANQCAVVKNVLVTQPTSALNATATSTNVSCFNYCNGTASVSANGGTAPYTYVWSNGNTNSNISGLCAGSYSVTVYDANQCSVVKNVSVTQPNELAGTTSQSNITCYNACNGTASVTATGGTAPYSYLWSNGGTNSSTSGLCATQYCVTVTDANQCAIVKCVTITQPTNISATVVGTDATICIAPNCNGAANLTVSGGVAPYTYLWSNGATTEDLSGLCAGTYYVTVKDANNCPKTAWVVINCNHICNIGITGYILNIGCNANCNGAINITVSNATSPTYHWSNGATTEDVTGLCAGTYSVTVTDAYQCTQSQTFIVNQNPPIVITITSNNTTNCSCNCNGSATASATGGVAPYSYHWSTGANTATITGLCAGTYSVTVTDAASCTKVSSVCIACVPPCVLTLTGTQINISCNGGSNGSIDLSVSGGTAPYTYHWSNNATTQDISGLAAGTYSVTVTSAGGCSGTKTFTLCQPAAICASVVGYNSCSGSCNGSADLSVNGGTAPYTYIWSNGATTQDLSGLCAGTYSVTVKDANLCSVVKSICITQNSQIIVTITGTNTTNCSGCCNGTASASVSGGTSPYTYHWSTGASCANLTGLCAGTYSLTVTDAAGCTKVGSVTISCVPPCSVTLSATVTNVSCNGGSNGAIDLSVSGTGTFTYHWNSGATTQDRTGLSAGTYSVTVTSSGGCSASASYCVGQPSAICASVVGYNTCYGVCAGSADLTVSGGTAPYTYIWSNGAATQDLSGLCAGTYSVTVKDANLCSVVKSVCITQNSQIVVTITGTNTTNCSGCCNGTASASVSGGTAPYTYHWSTGASCANLTGLCAGTYSLTVTDAAGCTKVGSVTISCVPPCTVTLSATVTNVSCNGGSNGAIDLSVNGTGTFTYHWNNGATTQDRTGLSSGTYSVTVTSSAGCSASASYCVGQPSALCGSICATNTCSGQCNGAADLTVSGGTAPYSYHWNSGATTQDRTCLCAGTYYVTITDASGCSLVKSVCIATISCGCGGKEEDENKSLTLTSSTNTELNMSIYPNPLNAQTTFEFIVSEDVNGTLELYSVTGALITEIYRGEMKAGQKYSFSFNADELAAGMYFARLSTNNGSVVQNIMKMK